MLGLRFGAGRQIEQALKWGVRYITFWAIYDNVLKKNVVLGDGEEATNDQLLGNWLIRPDGSLPEIYPYFKDILGRKLSTYQDRYEFEQAAPFSPTGDTSTTQADSGARVPSSCIALVKAGRRYAKVLPLPVGATKSKFSLSNARLADVC